MRSLAEKTGGVAFVNTNDLRGAIDKAIADTDLTYTLAFYPDRVAPAGRHKLKVSLNRHGVDLLWENAGNVN